jgi:hypothetical protein
LLRELLQPEPDPDAERTAEHRQQREIDADRLQRDQQPHDEQHGAQDLAEHHAHAAVDPCGALEPLLDQSRQPQRRRDRQDHDDRCPQELEHRDVPGAERDLHRVELVPQPGQHGPVKCSSMIPQIP